MVLSLSQLLRQFGVIESLLYFYEKGDPFQRVEYRTGVGLAGTTAMRVHERLYEAGLLESVPDPGKLLFKLSKKGERVAQLLEVLKEIVEDNIDNLHVERIINELHRILDEKR